MLTNRSYRAARPAAEALDELRRGGDLAGRRRVLSEFAARRTCSPRLGTRQRVPRYSDARILDQLTACSERLGRSPTMSEFSDDPRVRIHPQTVVERFGTWNAAKRRVGLVPRRFATRAELLAQLQGLGAELARVPTGRDLDERRARLPSRSLYWHRFGSLSNALREAGFSVPRRAERREQALEQGLELARVLGRPPTLADWRLARAERPELSSEWQVYRLFAGDRGGWTAFRAALRERL